MKLNAWKDPLILLAAIGISNIGAWIYLIALNLSVLAMTDGSALAVAGLYMTVPLAAIFTNFWAGSLIDRLNKRKLLIGLDLSRAALVLLLPQFDSLALIYATVFVLGMAGSIFAPASMAYVTLLLKPEQRQRFNALRSLVGSGAFLIGPAVAGALLAIGSADFALYSNAAALFLAAALTVVLPNLDGNKAESAVEPLNLKLIRQDVAAVIGFSRQNTYVAAVYLAFSLFMVLATALDSLEAAFSIGVLSLSEQQYGFLVSIAGAGIAAGSLIAAVLSNRLQVPFLIGGGTAFVSAGYLIYAFSAGFWGVATGFFVLAFALAFANTGFQTFYQDNIPVAMMGRIGSIYGLVEAVFIILLTFSFGVTADLLAIRPVIVVGSLLMLAVSVGLGLYMSGKRLAANKKYRKNAARLDGDFR
ncbi:MFS transporter [Planococcus salinarum]|uniref:MFS transporter n=1 Tax=Planococcus salinarum TaxID=622695 RepID=UPI000E3CE059|nr:MFS transporter [Planococcus salinarum]TAA72386.1 MFS transporter [Planococcus salinarum]